MSNQFSLMRENRFKPFFWTQFLGAFNDNVFKTALVTLIAFHPTSRTTIDGATLATLLPGLFILPFFLFSATAGQLADKFEKSKLIRFVKVFEIFIMLFAGLGFLTHTLWLLVAPLFMMGMHSTLFGPIKYAYLPQHLNQKELVGGNGMVEMGSFVAILIGQVLGAWLAMREGGEMITAIVIIMFSALGYWVSRGVPNSPAADASLKINWNPITETYHNVKLIWGQQAIWLAIVGISWFWFYGATVLAQFPNFAKTTLYGDESVFILLLTVFSLGIGIGSLMCEKLSRGAVEIGLVPLGAIGLTLFGADLFFSSTSIHAAVNHQYFFDYISFLTNEQHQFQNLRLLLDIAFIGLFGGVYIVPLYALIQTRSDKAYQSRIIAANNIMNALFMVVSAVFSILMFKQGLSIPQLFLVTALLNIIVTIYMCIRQPEYMKRFALWLKASFST